MRSPSPRYMEMPILAERRGGSSSLAIFSRMRLATRCASSSRDSGRTRANSSPPYRAAVNAENTGETADSPAADEMAISIVNRFQTVEIEKQYGKRTAGAIGAFRFVFENVKEAAVIGETGERVANGKMVDLFEEPRVIEKRATQRDGISQHHKRLGENKWSVQQARGLGGGELSGDIQPSGRINGAVESGILHGQPAAEPNEAYEENCAGQQLLRIREEGAGMARDFRRQTAKCDREHVGQSNYRQQSASDFAARMTRTRQEVLNQKRYDKQKRQNHAAEPPGDGLPHEVQKSARKNLKKENTCRGQNVFVNDTSTTENQ